MSPSHWEICSPPPLSRRPCLNCPPCKCRRSRAWFPRLEDAILNNTTLDCLPNRCLEGARVPWLEDAPTLC
eukprot:8965390-Pyramimonas_sp.AAC.2